MKALSIFLKNSTTLSQTFDHHDEFLLSLYFLFNALISYNYFYLKLVLLKAVSNKNEFFVILTVVLN